MKKWIIKNIIAITFFTILSIYLVLAGIFMPLDSYETDDCGMQGGKAVIVRHELIFGGSLKDVRNTAQSESSDSSGLITFYPCINGKYENHELFLL